jgi:rhodanese-related sulfurtransferase
MKKLWIPLFLTAVLLTLASCQKPGKDGSQQTPAGDPSAETDAKTPGKLSAEEAYARINSGDPVILLDVRTAAEYEEAHIPGAILLPNEEIQDTPPAALPVTDAEILVYCRSGNRSAQAAAKLVEMGYTNVYDFGGIRDWPYETESGAYEKPEKSGSLTSFLTWDLNGLPRDETVFSDSSLTMINIWATFCSPCLREMPELGELAEEYREKGVQIIGIVADVSRNKNGAFSQDMLDTARELAAETGADYLHLLPSNDLIYAKLGEVSSVPETIFVDSQGNLVGQSYVGSRSKKEWAAILDDLLSETAH